MKRTFLSWASEDAEDTRKIVYHIKGEWNGKKQRTRFTSEDRMDVIWLIRLRSEKCTIRAIFLINKVWYAFLELKEG